MIDEKWVESVRETCIRLAENENLTAIEERDMLDMWRDIVLGV